MKQRTRAAAAAKAHSTEHVRTPLTRALTARHHERYQSPARSDQEESQMGKHGGKPDPAESDGHKPDKPIPPPDPRRPEPPKR